MGHVRTTVPMLHEVDLMQARELRLAVHAIYPSELLRALQLTAADGQLSCTRR